MSRIYNRIKSSPRKALATVGVVALAVAVVIGSGANFNSSTANPNNQFSAGNLAQTNSKNGSAILTAATMKPGQSVNGTVDITNSGDIDGVFSLSKSNLVDTPASPGFSNKLDLVVEDCGDPSQGCASPTTKYTGKLGAMGTIALGTFTPAEAHRYRFTVTFPDGGANGADNAYKSAATTVQYDWTSVNN
jgi:spore coat-associated protein N